MFKRHLCQCDPGMPSLCVFKLSSFVESSPVPDAPEGFPGGQFLSPDGVCFSKVLWSSALCLPSPLRTIPLSLCRSPSSLPGSQEPRLRWVADVLQVQGLMVSDDSTGWKMASHRRSRSTSSECAGHSPPLGMSPQRCASFLPSLPYMEVFTFLPVASCLYSCPFRGTSNSFATATPLPSRFTSQFLSACPSGYISGGITSSKPKGPIKRYFPHPKKEMVP